MERKWVHMMFAVGGLILAWLLAKCGDWAWSYFGKPNDFVVGRRRRRHRRHRDLDCLEERSSVHARQRSHERAAQGDLADPQARRCSSTIVVIVDDASSRRCSSGSSTRVWAWVTRMIYG